MNWNHFKSINLHFLYVNMSFGVSCGISILHTSHLHTSEAFLSLIKWMSRKKCLLSEYSIHLDLFIIFYFNFNCLCLCILDEFIIYVCIYWNSRFMDFLEHRIKSVSFLDHDFIVLSDVCEQEREVASEAMWSWIIWYNKNFKFSSTRWSRFILLCIHIIIRHDNLVHFRHFSILIMNFRLFFYSQFEKYRGIWIIQTTREI